MPRAFEWFEEVKELVSKRYENTLPSDFSDLRSSCRGSSLGACTALDGGTASASRHGEPSLALRFSSRCLDNFTPTVQPATHFCWQLFMESPGQACARNCTKPGPTLDSAVHFLGALCRAQDRIKDGLGSSYATYFGKTPFALKGMPLKSRPDVLSKTCSKCSISCSE